MRRGERGDRVKNNWNERIVSVFELGLSWIELSGPSHLCVHSCEIASPRRIPRNGCLAAARSPARGLRLCAWRAAREREPCGAAHHARLHGGEGLWQGRAAAAAEAQDGGRCEARRGGQSVRRPEGDGRARVHGVHPHGGRGGHGERLEPGGRHRGAALQLEEQALAMAIFNNEDDLLKGRTAPTRSSR